MRIGRDGAVCSIEMVASDMPADMNACVLDVFDHVTYPAPAGGCVDATIPMSFRPYRSPQQP